MEKSNEEIGKIFKALGDSNRLKILDLIKVEEKCACKLLEELKIGQSTLSHHMKILCDSKIVNCRKDGKWSHYSLNKEIYRELESILKDIFTK
ncbi:metalloregulator ArsR/SmtB family transcription factor [uncultured Fusobacterium sp.]|uniref:ArsR/SmtB family transcription factor n=1 Tax=uncultured Fusobacterium sp. TaxID=159267 RepID=UPI0025FA18C0|nr:metalloregulator ArsR/SmtB family transcription factor [uncultured Fusobacterium sp.]